MNTYIRLSLGYDHIIDILTYIWVYLNILTNIRDGPRMR